MKARISLAAEFDLTEAVAFYDQQMSGLSARFLDEVDAAIQRIVAFPEAWQGLGENTRRCRLHRFPYGLIYSIGGDEILILAVAHLHREPEHWRDRSRD